MVHKQYPSTIKTDKHFIPGLDGLRALAVVAVILYHLFPYTFRGGYIGVDIFFVISGFLISTLLITEYAREGRINFKKFWLRRARRLLPALFATILIISSIIFFLGGDSRVGVGQQILGAATFSSNWVEALSGTSYFDTTHSHLFMNFWSLAVEEQFYLFWPLIVLLLIGIIKWPRIGIIVTGLIALVSVALMAYLFYHEASSARVYYGTDTHLFGLMIGALLAFLAYKQSAHMPPRRLLQPFWRLQNRPVLFTLLGASALGGLTILLFTLPNQSPFTYSGGLFLASLLTAVLLIVTVGIRGPLQRLFTLKPLVWIGTRSYGLYLWHWPLLVVLQTTLPPTLAWWIIPTSLVVLTFGIADLSYRYLELPFRQHGFWVVAKKAIKRRQIIIGNLPAYTYVRLHPAALVVFLLMTLTIGSVISAPTKTSAHLRVEAGEQALQTHHAAAKHVPLDGSHISVIGDSVTLASVPALQEKYPGIFITAEISRSLTRSGLETAQQLRASGQLRKVVVIALGTNGPYGAGNLDRLVRQLNDYKVIVVTAYADREWTAVNNSEVEKVAQKYNNVAVARWDKTIAARPDLLSADGIHPFGEGTALYVNCIDTALKEFE